MKIVINTNNYYKNPLKRLITSILNSGFKNFEDIIIVISESVIDEGPKLVNLSELVDVHTDKSEVEVDFYEKIIKFESINNDQIVVNGPIGNSNIIILGHEIIDLYGDRYNRNFTKKEAVLLEVSKEFILDEINYCGFYFHPNAIQYPEREEIGMTDIYNIGIDRIKYYYKEFGVYKYVLWFKDGDIKNNIIELDFN